VSGVKEAMAVSQAIWMNAMCVALPIAVVTELMEPQARRVSLEKRDALTLLYV
jgi:hypothetical protein